MSNHQEVFDLSRNHIAAILNNNQLPAHEYNFSETNHNDYYFLITFTYSFKAEQDTNTVAGGKGISGHHYNAAAYYQTTKDNYYRYAQNSNDEKLAFIKTVETKLLLYFKENKNKAVWEAPTITYSYNCDICYGTGKVNCTSCYGSKTTTCYSCGGNGSVLKHKTELDRYGNSHSFSVKEYCNRCNGGGNVTCNSCGGTGKRNCSTCGGQGYFTEYCNTQCRAKPATTYGAQSGIYAQEVIDYFLPHSNAYLCEVMTPEYTGGTWLENGQYRFNLKALITVVENTVTVQGKNFVEVAVNTVTGILYPPIFDHVLKVPFEKLSAATIKRQQVLALYHTVKDHHAVNHALLAYTEAGDAARGQKVETVHGRIRHATGGYISNFFSGTMSERVVHLMSRLAPHGTAWPWWLAGLICLLLEAILAAHMGYEPILGAESMDGFASLSAPMMGVEALFVLLLTIPTMIVNWLATRYRQRGVPNIHRPKVHHRKPFMWVVGIIAVAWYLIIAAIFLAYRYSYDTYLHIVQYGTVSFDSVDKFVDLEFNYSAVNAWVISHLRAGIFYVQMHSQ